MSAKSILIIILVVLFLIFVLQNIKTVTVHFLMFEVSMPRVLLLMITWAVGLLIGVLMPYEFKKSRSKTESELE